MLLERYLEKWGVVASHLKPLRRIAFLQEMVRRQGGFLRNIPDASVSKMGKLQKLFEARRLMREAVKDREYSSIVKNRGYLLQNRCSYTDDAMAIRGAPVTLGLRDKAIEKGKKIFGGAQKEYEANRLSRLGGHREMPKSKKWVNDPERPGRLAELPKAQRWIAPRESERHIYTDGSARGGRGGAAYSINGSAPTVFPVISGDSNYVEAQAANTAIAAAPHGFKGHLYTDSNYVLSNAQIRADAQQKQIGLRWTMAHSGNPRHNEVDQAAKNARRLKW